MKRKGTDTNMILTSGIKPRPMIDEKGAKLSDIDVILIADEQLTNYENENGGLVPTIDINFQSWIRETATEIRNHNLLREVDASIGEYDIKGRKNSTIQKNIAVRTNDYAKLN